MPEHVAELQAEEIHLLRLIREMVTPTVMIDVGAHHGTTCAPFLEAGWQVYAFEPIEANRAVLQQRWGTQPRLTIRSEAVSDCCGCKQLHLAVRPDGQLHDYFHSLEEVGTNAEYQAGPVIAVTTVSLDALVARGELPQRVGLLKIDTEGHDLAVLRGAQTIDAAVIIVEFWCEGLYGGRCPSPAEEMVRLLRQRQYYYFLAIVHEENQVRRQWSTLEGLGRQAWGNLFFFRDRETAIALQQRLEANADQPTVAEEKPRWLNLLSSVLPTTQEWVFYDVGAYQGDFTAFLLRHYPRALAVAFEPTPHSFDYLRIRFRHEPRVQLLPLALSDRTGVATYYLTEHAYNNSLLRPGDMPVCQSIEVPIDTLNRFRERDHRPVQLIKIDAQGHDLRILQGACHILKQDRPVILVEMTFIPMYEQQDDCGDLWQFLQQQGYRLAGWYNTHSTPEGLLAYADGLFVPVEMHQRLVPPRRLERYVCEDPQILLEQKTFLQKVCQERLGVIHRLEATCSERLRLIEELSRISIRRGLWMIRQALRLRLQQNVQQWKSQIKSLLGRLNPLTVVKPGAGNQQHR